MFLFYNIKKTKNVIKHKNVRKMFKSIRHSAFSCFVCFWSFLLHKKETKKHGKETLGRTGR